MGSECEEGRGSRDAWAIDLDSCIGGRGSEREGGIEVEGWSFTFETSVGRG